MTTIRECEERVIEAARFWVEETCFDPLYRDSPGGRLRAAVHDLDAARSEMKPPIKEDTNMIHTICEGRIGLFPQIEDRVREIAREEDASRWDWLLHNFTMPAAFDKFNDMNKRIADLEVDFKKIKENHDEIVRLEKRVDDQLRWLGEIREWQGKSASRLAALESNQSADSKLWHEHEEMIRAMESNRTPTTAPHAAGGIVQGDAGRKSDCGPTSAALHSERQSSTTGSAGNESGSSAPTAPASADLSREFWSRYCVETGYAWDGSRNIPAAKFCVPYLEKMLRTAASAAREKAIEECESIARIMEKCEHGFEKLARESGDLQRASDFKEGEVIAKSIGDSIRSLLSPPERKEGE